MLAHDRAIARIAASQHGVFTRAQTRAVGLSRAAVSLRVDAGLFEEVCTGVLRLTSWPRGWRQDLRAVTLVGPHRVVASHRAAAALHQLDGFEEAPVEVSVSTPSRVTLAGAIVHHVQRLDDLDLVVVDGVPTTGVARTLADLGSVVSLARVERALDDARRRGISLRWLLDTAVRLHRPGQAGTKSLLVLLDRIEHGGDVRGSWFEKLVEECLRSPHLPPLVRQHRVRDEHRRLAGILDVAFPAIRLGVEAHSRQFHFGRAAEHRDEDRDHRLARLGWEVLYVGWQGVHRPADLLSLVLDVARHRPTVRDP